MIVKSVPANSEFLRNNDLTQILDAIIRGNLLCDSFRTQPELRELLEQKTQSTIEDYHRGQEAAATEIQTSLAQIYATHLRPRSATTHFDELDPVVTSVQMQLEDAWISSLLKRLDWPTDIPASGSGFAPWYKSLVSHHPTSDHPLFQYLETSASTDDLATFFHDESLVDGRFDDLVALSQIGQVDGIKMEQAENYWDEMGNGDPSQVHTTLFDRLLSELGCEPVADILSLGSPPAWQSLASGNLLLFLVLHRRNSNRALGALGAVEMVSPIRFRRLVRAMERLGISDEARQYHELHIKIDTRHGNGWLKHAIEPLVSESLEARQEILEGTLMRFVTTDDHCNALLARMKATQSGTSV